ncbi:MAG: hypothetical protein COZ18_07145 [Flexibacter sp. CG_4_10_14_3_um_filter_32_15]|nr:MAG: hypothetical protein COZ18_07145 [Flexibacter sp. CG_4_10_14_3_um_filter_32_15]
MKYLIVIILCIFLSSCNDDNEQFIVDTALEISVKDSTGSNLLNPSTPNSLDENNIKIIYEIDGEQIEFNKPNLTFSKGFFIHQVENEHRIAIHLNTDKNAEYPVTYIKWNNIDTDTIKCKIERTSNSEICKKVWFNEKVVWEDFATERHFEIIK